MAERWVSVPRQQDQREGDVVHVKLLRLLTPEGALKQFRVKMPVLTSSWSTLSYPDTPLIYQAAGEVIEAPKFSPSRDLGISFTPMQRGALTTTLELQENSWLAVVEPIGTMYTEGGERSFGAPPFRFAKAVRVEEIRAYCYRCLEEKRGLGRPITDPIPLDDPLNQGLVVASNLAGDYLRAICGLEKHPDFVDCTRYNFRITENGEFTVSLAVSHK